MAAHGHAAAQQVLWDPESGLQGWAESIAASPIDCLQCLTAQSSTAALVRHTPGLVSRSPTPDPAQVLSTPPVMYMTHTWLPHRTRELKQLILGRRKSLGSQRAAGSPCPVAMPSTESASSAGSSSATRECSQPSSQVCSTCDPGWWQTPTPSSPKPLLHICLSAPV